MLKRKTPLKPSGLKPSVLVSGGFKSGGLKSGGMKVSKSPNASKKGGKKQWEADLAFYMKIWDKRDHICESCGERLGEFSFFFMDHLLLKSQYPELRHEEENIGLVCINCHGNRTNGFPTEKHQQLINKAKKRFL